MPRSGLLHNLLHNLLHAKISNYLKTVSYNFEGMILSDCLSANLNRKPFRTLAIQGSRSRSWPTFARQIDRPGKSGYHIDAHG